ncbi:MAG: HEAT repeat domain-containing protein [Chloroflexi bacterium]|nr:HEAT repeat domain-containing protein [Chloroflexota bacterium]
MTDEPRPSDDSLDDEDDARRTPDIDPAQVVAEIAAGAALDLAKLRALSEPNRETLAALLRLWPTIEPARRREVLAAMQQLEQDEAALDLHRVSLTALRDPDAATRMLAVRGLREQDRAEYMRLLAAQLRDDPVPMVRVEIAKALGNYVIGLEFGLLADDDAETLTAALRDAVEDVEETDDLRGSALESLGAWSDESTAEMISDLYEVGGPLLRIAAIRAMGKNASEGWLDLLIYHFDDEDADMRAAAAEAAGQLLMDEAVDPLVMLATEDKDDDVQVAAIRALGEIGNEEVERILNRWLKERRDSHIQDAIREALAEVQVITAEMMDGRARRPQFDDEDDVL